MEARLTVLTFSTRIQTSEQTSQGQCSFLLFPYFSVASKTKGIDILWNIHDLMKGSFILIP